MSHYPHRIRLRGPWECEPLARRVTHSDGSVEWTQTNLPGKRRMKMPCRWQDGGLAGFAGRVHFRRHFGYPGQIDDDERVWLVFEGFEGYAEIILNDRLLAEHDGTDRSVDFDVTALLTDSNNLEVNLESALETGGLWGDVALEIRRTAFLRDVAAWVIAENHGTTIHVSGLVVGTSARPLELYALLDNKTVAYRTLEASSAGQQFHLTELLGPEQSSPGEHQVRVELVDAATIWYAVELMVEIQDGMRD